MNLPGSEFGSLRLFGESVGHEPVAGSWFRTSQLNALGSSALLPTGPARSSVSAANPVAYPSLTAIGGFPSCRFQSEAISEEVLQPPSGCWRFASSVRI